MAKKKDVNIAKMGKKSKTFLRKHFTGDILGKPIAAITKEERKRIRQIGDAAKSRKKRAEAKKKKDN